VEVWPPTRLLKCGARRGSGPLVWLFLAAASLGCGSKEDLVLGRRDFALLRHDDFDTLDLDYWELATHTFGDNRAWFTPNNAKVEGGRLVLSITEEVATTIPAGEPTKAYSAAEVRTRAPFLYGRFRARARFAPGTGIVSAFWGFYDRYAMSSGPQFDNQIVTESGIPSDDSAPVFRYGVTVPTAGAPPTPEPAGYDPAAAFHVIGYDWTPTQVSFYADGQIRFVVSGAAAEELTQYQRLIMSAYPSQATWLAAFDPKQLPVTAEFDWVEIYAYEGPRP
jgi:beta-glucanase (GH16 family)